MTAYSALAFVALTTSHYSNGMRLDDIFTPVIPTSATSHYNNAPETSFDHSTCNIQKVDKSTQTENITSDAHEEKQSLVKNAVPIDTPSPQRVIEPQQSTKREIYGRDIEQYLNWNPFSRFSEITSYLKEHHSSHQIAYNAPYVNEASSTKNPLAIACATIVLKRQAFNLKNNRQAYIRELCNVVQHKESSHKLYILVDNLRNKLSNKLEKDSKYFLNQLSETHQAALNELEKLNKPGRQIYPCHGWYIARKNELLNALYENREPWHVDMVTPNKSCIIQ